MQLPAHAIRNHQFTLVVIMLLVLLGVVSFFTMPRSEDPQFDFSAALIKVVSPGTTPMDVEKLIVDPIESALNELDDIREIKTDIEDGLAVIKIEFLYGTDPDDKFDDVVGAVERQRSLLPASVAYLNVEKLSPSDVSILQLALISEQASYVELKKYADVLEQKLEQIAGVKRADVDALQKLEVQIQVEQKTANALGISLDEIAAAIQSAAQNIPGGHAHVGERRFTVRTSGDFESIEAIENSIVRAVGNRIIYIRDVAHVSLTEGLPSYKARVNGEKAVFVSAVQREGAQIFHVREDIERVLAEFKTKRLPDHIRLHTMMDQSLSVKRQIDNFLSSLNQGLILVAVMTFLVLGFRPTLIVVSAIPLSIFVGIGWLDMSGFGLQQMSIVGLVIALGLLVDNAIVVVENVDRHLRTGVAPIEAAVNGTTQVSWAITSGTLTTVLAYVPMLMMQNGSGTFLRAMPVTVCLTLMASLFIAMTFTPLLTTKIGGKTRRTPWLRRKMQSFSDGFYRETLNKALAKPIHVLTVSVVLLIATLALFPFIGVSLFPKAEKPMLLVNIDMPEGSSFTQTDLMAQQVEDIVRKHDLVIDIATNIGRGNPRIYYNVMPSRQTVNVAQLFVTLKASELPQVEPLVSSLRQELNAIPGAKIAVKEFLQGPPVDAPVEIRVLGDVITDIQKAALDVENIMNKTPGLVAVDNPIGKGKVDLHVRVNRDKAALLGIPLTTIDRTIRTALVGSTVGLYRDSDGEEYELVLRLSEYVEPQLDTFNDVRIATAQGTLVPLLQLASIELESNISRFQHYATERMAKVTADVAAGYTTEEVTNAVIDQLDQYKWPDGVHYSVGGEQASRKEAFGGVAKALLLTVMGILAVLVLQFKSFVQPLIVFTAVPFAVIGAFLALLLTGYTFSFTAFIGLTSLIGIVVSNSIILVDYANQMRKAGMSQLEAIDVSARTRFIPIMLTTLTTIGGLLPLTLAGSSMWSPMGAVIIGGLTTSTLLTLIVVPVLYRLLAKEEPAV